MSQRTEGTVKFFNRKKGFGFISGGDGQDYFVHFTAVPRGVFLRDNDKVSFDAVEGDRGLKAENVQLLQKGSERTDIPQAERSSEPAQEKAESDSPETEESNAEQSADDDFGDDDDSDNDDNNEEEQN